MSALGALRASLLSQDSEGYMKIHNALGRISGGLEIMKLRISLSNTDGGENKISSLKCRGCSGIASPLQRMSTHDVSRLKSKCERVNQYFEVA